MKRKIDGVLFDFDGTLVDTYRLYVETYRHVLAEYHGKSFTFEEIVGLQLKAEIRFFLDPPYRDDFDRLYRAFMEHYDERHEHYCDGEYPGAFAVVDAIQDRGLLTGLVTGKSRAAYDLSVSRTGAPEFAVSICDDDVNLPKPDPEGLLRACQILELQPTRMIYVGDSQVDLDAAVNVGAIFAGVLWAKNAAEQAQFRALCAAQPDAHLFSAPSELLEFLDEA